MKFLREGARVNRDWFGTPDAAAAEMAAILEPLGYIRREPEYGSTYAIWSKRIGNLKVFVTGHGANDDGGSPYAGEAAGAKWYVTVGEAGNNGQREIHRERITDVMEAAELAKATEEKVKSWPEYKDMSEEEYKRLDTEMGKEISDYYARAAERGGYTGD